VELDAVGDVGGGGFVGFSGGVVAGFLGFAGAGAVGSVADAEGWVEDLEQERGQGQVKLAGGNAVTVSVAAVRAWRKLICSGGMPVASAPAPMSWAVAW
jgi:hypothetical protein